MPMEPSEAEIIIHKHLVKISFGSDLKKATEAMAEELQAAMKPVIDRLNQELSWAAEELEECREELIAEAGEAEDLRGELVQFERDKEFEKLVKIFEEC